MKIVTVFRVNIAVSEEITLMYVGEVVSVRSAPKIRTVEVLMSIVTPMENVKIVRDHLPCLAGKSKESLLAYYYH